MKVLHILMDAISPMNTFLLTDPTKYERTKGYKSKVYNTTDPRGNMLLSPQMWCRTYTGKELWEWSPSKLNERWDPTDTNQEARSNVTYLNIDKDEMIWNKVASKGLPAFIFPYYSYSVRCKKCILGSKNPELINGVFRTFGKSLGYKLESGEFSKYYSNHTYYGMHETPEEYMSDDPEHAEWVRNKWDTSTDAELKEWVPKFIEETRPYITSHYDHDMMSNTHVYEEEVLKTMSNVDYSNGGYAHIGVLETDSWMHFAQPYDDLVLRMNIYLESLVNHAIDIMDPDVIIIHGDHGQDKIREKHRQKLWSDVIYNGVEYRAARAKWVRPTMFNDHSWNVGGWVFAKDQKYLDLMDKHFESQVSHSTYYHTPLFMDSVRDFIIDEIDK